MSSLVSIVTPVYNGEAYLRDCVESVLAQTYENWDYTIVDNCSSDRTLAIASEYAARDPRIRVHTNTKFVPVIANYNNAFRQASPQSKYCKPLAGDDILFPECIERMVALAEKHPSVALVGAYGLLSGTKTSVYFSDTPYPTDVFRGRDLAREFLLGRCKPFGAATWFMFRSEVVRRQHAFYNEANINADEEACLDLMEHYDFGFVHQVLTLVRSRDDSLASASLELNTWKPSRLHLLLKYGPKYLNEKEQKERIDSQLRDYYRYLGGHFARGQARAFWRYHKSQLAELGYPLSFPRLLTYAGLYVADLALNPKLTARRLKGYFRRHSMHSKASAQSYPRPRELSHPESW
jgi:glycosyltransferase involved in cell wall biosynthesis